MAEKTTAPPAPVTKPAPSKKTLKLPHLLWIMLGLIFFMSVLTYLIPAGQFATDPVTKQLLGDKFAYAPSSLYLSSSFASWSFCITTWCWKGKTPIRL